MPDRLISLQARPLRADRTRLLAGVVTLPGLALAVTHAPLALVTLGPLIGLFWAWTWRDRYRLDRAQVLLHVAEAALLVRYQQHLLAAVDLRYAQRDLDPRGVLLWEGGGCSVLLGDDPPADATTFQALPREGQGEPRAPYDLNDLQVVRLRPADMQRLRQTLGQITAQPPPREDRPAELLQALGSVGPQGPRAEAALRQHLALAGDGRPSAVHAALQELALRSDAAGEAARRALQT